MRNSFKNITKSVRLKNTKHFENNISMVLAFAVHYHVIRPWEDNESLKNVIILG
jgi:hypothetical protein